MAGPSYRSPLETQRRLMLASGSVLVLRRINPGKILTCGNVPTMPEREGLLIGRIVIEKYAMADDIGIYIDSEDGSGDEMALVDALGMTAFAQAHFASAMNYYDPDEDDSDG